MGTNRALLVLAASLLISACEAGGDGGAAVGALPAPVELAAPAGPGSAEPYLHAAPDGTVLLSWIEPLADSSLPHVPGDGRGRAASSQLGNT